MVQRGELKPGDMLPTVRDLADDIGVNRNTVAAAYQRLTKAGIALTQGRLGTVVCEPFKAGEQEGVSEGTALIDLADGNPNPEWLPDLNRLIGTLPRPYLYGEETIIPELRQFAKNLFSSDCPESWELELTHGAVDAIERLCATHLLAGDSVALESPCFLGTINALRLASMATIGVEMDEQGMMPSSLREALDGGARAVFLTPRAQNPTGCSFTQKRAEQLREVLTDYPNVLVVVDDHFSLLGETPYYSVIPSSTTSWALIRSVSKGLGPDLRLAFVASDILTARRLRARLAPGVNWVSHILQKLVIAGLTSEYGKNQLHVAREGYVRRRGELHAALLAVRIPVPIPSGGFNFWIPVERDAQDVAYALARRGWLVRPGTVFDVSGHSEALRVTISQMLDGQAAEFADDLRACLDATPPRRRIRV